MAKGGERTLKALLTCSGVYDAFTLRDMTPTNSVGNAWQMERHCQYWLLGQVLMMLHS